MTLTNFAPWSDGLLYPLAETALRTLLLAAIAGIGLVVFRVKSTSLRLFTWSGVLYAALALPLLSWMLPVLQIPVPSVFKAALAPNAPAMRLSAQRSEPASTLPVIVHKRAETGLPSITAPQAFASPLSSETSSLSAVRGWISSNWLTLVTALYVAITCLLMARLALGVSIARRLLSHSPAIRDSHIAESLASYLQTRTRAPRILESDLVAVPVTLGTLRPAIVLPANWRMWNRSRLDAVIAHELSHVTRCDCLTQFLSQIYRAVFWFSPLSWWLDGHLHLLAEQASDEAALSGGVDRKEYARTLLEFLESLQAAPRRVWWQGVAMAKAGRAEHRLERILSWRGAVNMQVKRFVLVAFIAVAVPAIYLAAAARPTHHAIVFAQDSASPQAVPSVAPVPEPAPPVAPVAQPAPIQEINGAPMAVPLPAAPAAPAFPAVPAIASSGQSQSYGDGHGRGYSYTYGFDDEQRFVIVSGKSDSFTMSGTSGDARHVQRLKKQIPGDFIWFQRDEKSYIIRDQATIDRARKLWSPQEELGKKQEELGKQQEALGTQQEELGAKMEQVRVNIPDMTAQMDALKAKLQKLGPTATIEQLGDLQSEIGELQGKIGEIQSHAGEAQGKFGAEQGALGEKQGELGELQGELGRQQAELAERATKQMKALLDEAIKNGTAKREPDTNDDGGTI